ncbi:hypothetical protein BJ170DRAFT_682808 [Xylariales sp. AK1849]|nr:hypothetical protein BJ170DRAFT_682808 [Xylariales sp. AK1849]
MNLFRLAAMLAIQQSLTSGFVIDSNPKEPRGIEIQSSGSLLGRFDDSGLNFHIWLGRMVDQGHLYQPNISDSLLLARSDSWSVKLKNVACTTVHGNRDVFASTQKNFCGWVQAAEEYKAKQMEEEVTHTLCADGQICRMFIRTVFNQFSLFQNVDDVTKLCNQMFDSLNEACPDGGGVADVEVGDNHGGAKYGGKVEASFSADNGESCQSSETHRCYDHHV